MALLAAPGDPNGVMRDRIIRSIIAQSSGWPDPYGGAPEPYQYPTDPSDPADYSSGFTQEGSAQLGDLGGLAPGGFASSVAQQGFSDTGFSPSSPSAAPTGTGLGMAVTGYNSGYGTQADMASTQADAITAGIIDAMSTSQDVNAAVEEGGYTDSTGPSNPGPIDPGFSDPGPSNPDAPGFNSDPGAPGSMFGGFNDPGGFTSANAGLSDPGGFTSDPGGFTSDPGGFGDSGDSGSGGGAGGGSGK